MTLLLFFLVVAATITFASADCFHREHDECVANADACMWIQDCKDAFCCNKGDDGKCLNAINCSQHGGDIKPPAAGPLDSFTGSLSLQVKSTTSLKAMQRTGTSDTTKVLSSEWFVAFGLNGGYHSNRWDGHLGATSGAAAAGDVAWVDRVHNDDDKTVRTLQVSSSILIDNVDAGENDTEDDGVSFDVKLWNTPGTEKPVEAQKVYVGHFRVSAAAINAAKDGDTVPFDGVPLQIKDKDGEMVDSGGVTIDVQIVVHTMDGTCANQSALPCLQGGPRTQFAGWKGCRDLLEDSELDGFESCGGISQCCDQVTVVPPISCSEAKCDTYQQGASQVANASKKYMNQDMPYSCCQGIEYAAVSVLLSVKPDNIGTSDAQRSPGRALMCAVVKQGGVNPSRVSVSSTFYAVTNTDGSTNNNYVYARVRVLPYKKMEPKPACEGGLCFGHVCSDDEPDGTTPEPSGEDAIAAFKAYYHFEQPGADSLADCIIMPSVDADNNPVQQMRTCARHGGTIVAGERAKTCAAFMEEEDKYLNNHNDDPPPSDNSGKDVDVGVIVGAVCGGLVALSLLMYCVCCRSKHQQTADQTSKFVPLV